VPNTPLQLTEAAGKLGKAALPTITNDLKEGTLPDAKLIGFTLFDNTASTSRSSACCCWSARSASWCSASAKKEAPMITLSHYLVVSGMLFALGLAGVIARRNILIVYMCLEMMLSAANLALVGFSRFHLVNGLPDYTAQSLVFFTITVAAAEVAVGLAIIVALFRTKQSVDVESVTKLQG
jgi:NADH-quinone oxidoreductase subunit K